MAALNHAIMIPGLIIVVLIFWLWIPIWAIVWCCRRASGHRDLDAELQAGHVPHKGFQPPAGSDYLPYRPETQFLFAPLKTGKHHFHNAAQKRAYEKKRGIVGRDHDDERRKRRQQRAAVRDQAVAARRAAEKKERNRSGSVSQSSAGPYSSDVSLVHPQPAVARESQRQRRAQSSRR